MLFYPLEERYLDSVSKQRRITKTSIKTINTTKINRILRILNKLLVFPEKYNVNINFRMCIPQRCKIILDSIRIFHGLARNMLFKNDLMEKPPRFFFVVLMPILCFLKKLSSSFKEDIRRSLSTATVGGVYLYVLCSYRLKTKFKSIILTLFSFRVFIETFFGVPNIVITLKLNLISIFFGAQKQTLFLYVILQWL